MHEANNSLPGNGNRATFSLLVSLKEMNAYFLGKRNLVTHYQVRDNISARVRLQNRGLRVQKNNRKSRKISGITDNSLQFYVNKLLFALPVGKTMGSASNI